eukprot:667917-Amphidinium_carterae.1
MLEKGYHILAFDAPGFGRSEGVAGQTKSWREWDADLILALLQCFRCDRKGCVTVFGECMGAAMFVRALLRSPDTFAAWHVLHNFTI